MSEIKRKEEKGLNKKQENVIEQERIIQEAKEMASRGPRAFSVQPKQRYEVLGKTMGNNQSQAQMQIEGQSNLEGRAIEVDNKLQVQAKIENQGNKENRQSDAKRLSDIISRLSTQSSQGEQDTSQQEHKFWETQPVPQFKQTEKFANRYRSGNEGREIQLLSEQLAIVQEQEAEKQRALDEQAEYILQQQQNLQAEGPIDKPKTLDEVQKESMYLPEFYYWSNCDLDDPIVVEEVYRLLSNNYVEDDDQMFRFNYGNDILQWALKPPGYSADWHVGVRQRQNNKLVGFIAAIPQLISIKGKKVPMVEIDFLCVHKKLRLKRLAPILIKEITRRVNLQNIWYATYTAGVTIPKPISTTRYYHRLINAKKLVEVGFTRIPQGQSKKKMHRFYTLPEDCKMKGVREMRVPEDVEQVKNLLNKYLQRFDVHPVFSSEEIAHQFQPRQDVIEAFVVEDNNSVITDFMSFYNIPSAVLGHPQHSSLKAAYMYYMAPVKHTAQELISDMLILVQQREYDVFSMLDIMENQLSIKDLKFSKGDGELNYYFYNWRINKEIKAEQVGLILV